MVNRLANCHENPKIENSKENNVCNDKTDNVEDKILNIASKIAQEDDYKKEEVMISDPRNELKFKLTEKVNLMRKIRLAKESKLAEDNVFFNKNIVKRWMRKEHQINILLSLSFSKFFIYFYYCNDPILSMILIQLFS